MAECPELSNARNDMRLVRCNCTDGSNSLWHAHGGLADMAVASTACQPHRLPASA